MIDRLRYLLHIVQAPIYAQRFFIFYRSIQFLLFFIPYLPFYVNVKILNKL